MSEQLKEQLKRAARNLLARPPLLRGPWFISEEQLRKFLDEN